MFLYHSCVDFVLKIQQNSNGIKTLCDNRRAESKESKNVNNILPSLHHSQSVHISSPDPRAESFFIDSLDLHALLFFNFMFDLLIHVSL